MFCFRKVHGRNLRIVHALKSIMLISHSFDVTQSDLIFPNAQKLELFDWVKQSF